jgi:hypothetical protein
LLVPPGALARSLPFALSRRSSDGWLSAARRGGFHVPIVPTLAVGKRVPVPRFALTGREQPTASAFVLLWHEPAYGARPLLATTGIAQLGD